MREAKQMGAFKNLAIDSREKELVHSSGVDDVTERVKQVDLTKMKTEYELLEINRKFAAVLRVAKLRCRIPP